MNRLDSRLEQLTEKQREIYDYIKWFLRERSYPPSVREIAAAVGLKSPSTVHFHLKAMEEQGFLTRRQGRTRSIALVDPEKEEYIRQYVTQEYLKVFPQYEEGFKVFFCNTSSGVDFL